MTTTDFRKFLLQPNLLNKESLVELDTLVESHPWFATAQLLLAKNLYNLKHIRYQNRLKLASIATIERNLLKKFILDDQFSSVSEPLGKNIANSLNESPSDLLVLKDLPENDSLPEPLETGKVETKPVEMDVVESENFSSTDESAEKDMQSQDWEPIPFESYTQIDYTSELLKLPEISQPIEPKNTFNRAEGKMSFSDWLKHSNSSAVSKPDSSDSPIKDTIVEKFIADQPRISKPKQTDFFKPKEAARKSLSLPEGLVTETLAQIYEQQGHIERAIRAYEKLTVKHPEKFTYFAARIIKLKERLTE